MILNLSFLKNRFPKLTSKRYAGHPVSRLFRHVFENKRAKRAVGLTLTFGAVVVSTVGTPVSALSGMNQTEINTLVADRVELTTKSSVRDPLDTFKVTQRFHLLHPGLDLQEVKGAPVYPLMSGTVELVSYNRFSYGNHIIINHGGGYKSLYAHLSKINVKPGDEVDINTVIGLVGSTGWSTGNHLHLEIHENGHKINPQTILPNNVTLTLKNPA